ncbi:UdgX family uracil-DNA binding protein [Crossiella sp. SN42]|uniref:UdgX family uracil-DNA binding protein n=1 Tax=Crossiella sp. SN42 TaxID=2944808 RepID=UPI00207C4E53|nr:UdgX family uracil-DNA binding protein [Crossiella sp. SN42]MCO1576287.1 UdgX family uracil-DNA binding protein [Crossiella sp. SN42]
MAKHPGANPPEDAGLDELRTAVQGCRGCDLYREATQAVFGDGPAHGRVMFIGEQPGDQEDKAGEPFVGPAGRLLDKALVEAGIDRATAYVTNAVKHFKFQRDARGKRRIHQKPTRSEVVACRPWLVAELGAVRPDLVVCLGATAAQSVLGAAFRLTAHRGELLELPEEFPLSARVLATQHPSAVLRAPDREAAYAALVQDLKVAAAALSRAG